MKQILRELVEAEKRGLVSLEEIQYFRDNLGVLRALRSGRYRVINGKTGQKVAVKHRLSRWHRLFGHFNTRDRVFQEKYFPLEPLDGREVEVWQLDTIVGSEALRLIDERGYELAGMHAVGKYLAAHPNIDRGKSLVGGARWCCQDSIPWVPVFFSAGSGRESTVMLDLVSSEFHDSLWLVQRKKQVEKT